MASIKPKYLNKLSKADRLSRKRWIEELFAKGKSVKSKSLRALFLINNDLDNPQVLISVPKRNFKKASARNLLKRRIREAYRIHKHILNVGQGRNLMIAYIYLEVISLPYKEIEEALIKTLNKMNVSIEK